MSVPSLGPEGRQIYEGYEVLSPQKKNVGNGQTCMPGPLGKLVTVFLSIVAAVMFAMVVALPNAISRMPEPCELAAAVALVIVLSEMSMLLIVPEKLKISIP